MYGGYVVEASPATEIFERPRHPYTAALLRALPETAVEHQDRRLTPIPGQPPDLVNLPEGCPFTPRCEFARSACAEVTMDLEPAGTEHWTACPFAAAGTL
jgi:oligopeptide/dipeptide ABC transporter ATP-binding protein